MLIDYDNKAIFVHIPKTAGISVTACLKHKVGPCVTSDRSILSYSLESITENVHEITNITEHSGVNDIIAGGFPKVNDINNYFVYTVIRNPWGQTLSYYHFFKMLELPDFVDITFEEFVLELPNNNLKPPSHYGFIFDSRGYNRVDAIVYLEDFDNQWKEKIHNNLPMYPQKVNSMLNNTQLPFYDYRNDYTTEMVDIISKERSKDIEIFGYTFDGGPTHLPDVDIPKKIEAYNATTNWVTAGEMIKEENALAHGIIQTNVLKKVYKQLNSK